MSDIATGYKDRYGNDICVGDYVKFRCKGMSGRGIVFETDDKEIIDKYGKYMIQDTRTIEECRSRNVGRMYPFYDDALYTVLANSEVDHE